MGSSLVSLWAPALIALAGLLASGCTAPHAGAPKGSCWGGPDDLCVAIAQPLVEPGEVDANITRMGPMVAEAARRGAHLVVFSETGITGLDHEGISGAAAIRLDGPELERVDALARTHDVVIIAGFYERADDGIYNSAVVFYPDGRRVLQRKYAIAGAETRFAQRGERERVLFDIRGMRCGLLICADDGIPNITQELAEAGCEVRILITAGGGSESIAMRQAELADPERRATYAQGAAQAISVDMIRQAIELDMAMIACNQSGWVPEHGYYHGGGSSIIDRTGRVSAVIPYRMVLEHVKPDLAVGIITPRAARAAAE